MVVIATIALVRGTQALLRRRAAKSAHDGHLTRNPPGDARP